MLGIFLMRGRPRIINTDDFDELWEEISKFKKLNEPRAEESPDFIGLQDERGRMLLIALYDKDHWVIETLEEDWGTPFGRINLAGDLNVGEALTNDGELKTMLKTLMTAGRLPPSTQFKTIRP